MNEEKKIYVVTSGCYSDYCIDRVFSTMEKALEFLDTRDDDYDIEEYILDEPIEREDRLYCVSFRLYNKELIRAETLVTDEPEDSVRIYYQYINFIIKSDSKQRVIKIAHERFGAVIANEKTMYPFLRLDIIESEFSYIPKKPRYDFFTGEIILSKDEKINVPLPEWAKIRHYK